MNDEETVALIAGGHTFGKTHGAGNPDLVGPEPEGCPVHSMGLGWISQSGSGKGADTITSGLEGAWTPDAHRSGTTATGTRSSASTGSWSRAPPARSSGSPKEPEGQELVPDAHIEGKMNPPMMSTADMALLQDPEYRKISERFRDNPEEFADAFARAWYKLLHRDMGPVSRFLGPWVPEPQLWQDPVPAVDHDLVDDADSADLKAKVLDAGVSVQDLVFTAWASASSYRDTDKRGGANGARIRLAPQKDWAANDPQRVGRVLQALEGVQQDFNGSQSGGKRISLADLIVLGGCAAVEKAARDAGHDVTVPFAPGRTDATDEMTDADSFSVLEPKGDGFRQYVRPGDKLPAGAAPARQGQPAGPERAGDDRPRRRPPGHRRQPRRHLARRAHRPAGRADERLLRQPARCRHRVGDLRGRRRRLRRQGPQHR